MKVEVDRCFKQKGQKVKGVDADADKIGIYGIKTDRVQLTGVIHLSKVTGTNQIRVALRA